FDGSVSGQQKTAPSALIAQPNMPPEAPPTASATAGPPMLVRTPSCEKPRQYTLPSRFSTHTPPSFAPTSTAPVPALTTATGDAPSVDRACRGSIDAVSLPQQ